MHVSPRCRSDCADRPVSGNTTWAGAGVHVLPYKTNVQLQTLIRYRIRVNSNVLEETHFVSKKGITYQAMFSIIGVAVTKAHWTYAWKQPNFPFSTFFLILGMTHQLSLHFFGGTSLQLPTDICHIFTQYYQHDTQVSGEFQNRCFEISIGVAALTNFNEENLMRTIQQNTG